jgi:hypothetical protein
MFDDNLKEFEQAPQTVEEFERWGMLSSNPTVHKAMHYYAMSHARAVQLGVTREQALWFAVWALAKENAELQGMLYQKVLREPIQMFGPVYTPLDKD